MKGWSGIQQLRCEGCRVTFPGRAHLSTGRYVHQTCGSTYWLKTGPGREWPVWRATAEYPLRGDYFWQDTPEALWGPRT